MKLFEFTRIENLTSNICAHYCTTSFYRKGLQFGIFFKYQDLDRSVDARLQGVKNREVPKFAGHYDDDDRKPNFTFDQ